MEAATFCTINFHTVPSGKRLEISNVTCQYILLSTAARVFTAELLVSNKGKTKPVATQFLTPTFVAVSNGNSYFAASAEIFAFAEAGQKFSIDIGGTSDSEEVQAECSISGHMISL